MKRKLTNIFELIDFLISKEKTMGIKFDERGLPVFERRMFYDMLLPEEMLPYRHRKASKSPKETAVCFYEPDDALYRRIEKLDETAAELNNYACFVGFDLSIFGGFLKPFQDFYVLANLVIDIYFILRGNKMIPNLRANETKGNYFDLFKEAPIVCCGTLGCSLTKKIKNKNRKLIEEHSINNPHQILIQYGSSLIKRENTISYKPFGWRTR